MNKNPSMKSGNSNSASFRAPGQRSITSTFRFRASNQCSDDSIDPSSKKNKCGSKLSLNAFLNRKLHTTSVLPINKDENTTSVVKKETFPLAADSIPLNPSVFKDKRRDCEALSNEKGHVIEDSVFKLFNGSGGKVRKRSSECTTVASRVEGDSKQNSQNHMLVLGDDPKPKRKANGVTCSNKKPKPYYNHWMEVAYVLVALTDENGTGWWEPERVGVDSDEVGNSEMWEGMGSTTLGGINWH